MVKEIFDEKVCKFIGFMIDRVDLNILDEMRRLLKIELDKNIKLLGLLPQADELAKSDSQGCGLPPEEGNQWAQLAQRVSSRLFGSGDRFRKRDQ